MEQLNCFTNPNVLILDPDENAQLDIEGILEVLNVEGATTIVQSPAKFRRAIKERLWDILVVNFQTAYFMDFSIPVLRIFIEEAKISSKTFLACASDRSILSTLRECNISIVRKSYDFYDMTHAFGHAKELQHSIPNWTTAKIQMLVAEAYALDPDEIVENRSRKRKHKCVESRQVIMYLAKMYTGEKLKQIGRHFRRDHTTVMHSLGVVRNLMETDESFRHKVQQFENRLRYGA